MKKLFLFLCLYLLTISTNYIFSEEYSGDCNIVCPSIEWGELLMTDILPGPFPACTTRVYYRYRYCDCPELQNPWCDFKIEDIEITGCHLDTIWWTQYRISNFMMKELIEEFGPKTICFRSLPNNDSTTFISINYANCWRFGVGDFGGVKLAKCGDSEHCCREVWKLKKRFDGTFEGPAILLTQMGISHICPGLECVSICEPTYNHKNSLNTDEFLNTEFGDKAKVYPNPANQIINIEFQSETIGQHKIEISNLVGDVIYEESFTKLFNERLLQLNLINLSNGNYRFVIKYEGKPRINGIINYVN